MENSYQSCQTLPIFRTVFCDAYHKSLYGDKIQWLIVGMYEVSPDWHGIKKEKLFLKSLFDFFFSRQTGCRFLRKGLTVQQKR